MGGFGGGMASGLAQGWAGMKIRQHNEQVTKEAEMLQWLQKVGAEAPDKNIRDWANQSMWAIVDPSRKYGKPAKLEPPPIGGQGQQKIDAFIKGAPTAEAPAGAGAGTVLPTQGTSGQQGQPQAGVPPQQPQMGGTTDPMTGLPLGMSPRYGSSEVPGSGQVSYGIMPQGQNVPLPGAYAGPSHGNWDERLPAGVQPLRPPGILGPTSEPAAAAPQVPQGQAAQAQVQRPVLPPPPLVGTPEGGSVAQPPPGAQTTPQGWVQRTGPPAGTGEFYMSPGARAQQVAMGTLQGQFAARQQILANWDKMTPAQQQQAAAILNEPSLLTLNMRTPPRVLVKGITGADALKSNPDITTAGGESVDAAAKYDYVQRGGMPPFLIPAGTGGTKAKEWKIEYTKGAVPLPVTAIDPDTGDAWHRGDANMPAKAKERLDQEWKTVTQGMDIADERSAKKEADIWARQLQRQDNMNSMAAKRVAQDAINTQQRMNDAAAAGKLGTTTGDYRIVEDFMQISFGKEPRGIRGSPQWWKQVETIAREGGGEGAWGRIAGWGAEMSGKGLLTPASRQELLSEIQQAGQIRVNASVAGAQLYNPKFNLPGNVPPPPKTDESTAVDQLKKKYFKQ